MCVRVCVCVCVWASDGRRTTDDGRRTKDNGRGLVDIGRRDLTLDMEQGSRQRTVSPNGLSA